MENRVEAMEAVEAVEAVGERVGGVEVEVEVEVGERAEMS